MRNPDEHNRPDEPDAVDAPTSAKHLIALVLFAAVLLVAIALISIRL